VPSKSKPLNKAQLAAYESTRDLATELLESVRQMKAGKVQVVSSPVIEARKKPACLSRNSPPSWVCQYVPCRAGSKDASSRAAPHVLFWPSPAPIPRPYWRLPSSSCQPTSVAYPFSVYRVPRPWSA
jgi:hypothetical protein